MLSRDFISKEFFVCLVGAFPGVSLTENQRTDLSHAISATDYELPVLKEAATNLLQDLDLSSPYDRNHGRKALVANLLDAAEAALRDRKRRAADRAAYDAGKIRIVREAAEARVKRAAERAAEAELAEVMPVWE